MAAESKKTIYAALGANASIAVAKGIGGVVTGSSALLAEAAHSIADTTNQVFLLLSLSFGERKPDEEHPFGHGKERFFWAFLVAVLIFVAGGIFSIGEGLLSLFGHSEERSSTFFVVVYSVLFFSLVVEAYALLRAVRQLRGQARALGKPFFAHVRESKDPTVKVVFFEDAAAVSGVLIALGGTALAHATGRHFFDGAAAMLIGALLMVVAFHLGRETKGLLIGESASAADREALRGVLEGHRSVAGLHELLTMHVGPASILVAAHVDLAGRLGSDEIERVADELSAQLREAVPAVSHVYIDPTPPRRDRAQPP